VGKFVIVTATVILVQVEGEYDAELESKAAKHVCKAE